LHLDTDFKGKKILVIGAGISGFAAAKVLKRLGAKVTLSDAKDEAAIKEDVSELRALGIGLIFGAQEAALLDDCDLLVLSPAVPVASSAPEKRSSSGVSALSGAGSFMSIWIFPSILSISASMPRASFIPVSKSLSASSSDMSSRLMSAVSFSSVSRFFAKFFMTDSL